MNLFHWGWLLWLALGLGIEAAAVADGRSGSTLSSIVWHITEKFPLLPLITGIILGHFFWQKPDP